MGHVQQKSNGIQDIKGRGGGEKKINEIWDLSSDKTA